jgi:HEPN domain-containing protein
MPPEALEEARDWLARSRQDLAAASLVLNAPTPLCDVAAYHCQRAAEKGLKGFLAAHDIPFPKTHELERLVKMCRVVDGTFSRFEQAAQELEPYISEFRYPGGRQTPTETEARTALDHASAIVEYVSTTLGLSQ